MSELKYDEDINLFRKAIEEQEKKLSLAEIIPTWYPKIKAGLMKHTELAKIAHDCHACVVGEARLGHDGGDCEVCDTLSKKFGAWAYYQENFATGGEIDKEAVAYGEHECDCDDDEECDYSYETAYTGVSDGDILNVDELLAQLEQHYNEVHLGERKL